MNLISLRLAGSDTTAISLRAVFYYVIKTPRVYEKLVEEIDAADRHGQLSAFVTYEECRKLPYLYAGFFYDPVSHFRTKQL